MLRLSDVIMNSINSPYNYHILNFCNNIKNLQIQENINFIIFEDIEIKDFVTLLSTIDFDDIFFKSIQFLKLLDIIEIKLKKIDENKLLITKIESEIYLLIDQLRLNINETNITNFIDKLESKVSSKEIIIKDLSQVLDKSINIDFVYNTIIDIIASIYGFISSLQINDKWSNIIKNNDEFIKLLKLLNKSKYIKNNTNE